MTRGGAHDRELLDVNVLIALLDATHSFHARAHVWRAAEAAEGWASCPLTENGWPGSLPVRRTQYLDALPLRKWSAHSLNSPRAATMNSDRTR